MSPKWQMDLQAFADAGRELMDELGKTEAEFLKQQGRLLLDDLVHMTPPFIRGSSGKGITSQSYALQRKVGENAVKRDIKKVFRPFSPLGRYLARKSTDKHMQQRIADYAADGNLTAIRTIVKDMLGQKTDVRREVEPALQMVRRNKKGRVSSDYPITFILNERQLKSYIKEVQSHVGFSKSGWARAAQALGYKMPNWITRHNAPGLFKDESAAKPVASLTIGNVLKWSDDYSPLSIVETALKIRTESMQKQLIHLIDIEAGKFNRKKFQ